MSRIIISPPGPLCRSVDACLSPLMRLISGAFREAPQQTHRWNNIRIRADKAIGLQRELMVTYRGGIPPVRWKYGLPIMHISGFGGWSRYVVVEPLVDRIWHPGWVADDVVGASRYAVQGPVRLLYEGGNVSFFGIMYRTGKQLALREVGRGTVGDGGPFKNLPLF